uniref:NADP-dependent oxidoreductase domain-containing protein n=1 Tax=Hanusia phi TaxID=3032 RepID=A0A7S0HUD1_9CRYP
MVVMIAEGVSAFSVPSGAGMTGRTKGLLSRASRPTGRRMATCMKAMEYVKLGSSDLKVSRCCLGTMTWGQQNTMDEGVEQLNVAFDEFGVNFIDTAEMYPIPVKAETQGDTDRTIAKWLKTKKREDVVLATKVAGYSDRITWLPGRDGKGSRVTRKEILTSVDESLKRLNTDYIDLLQIHWPDRHMGNLFGAPGTYDISKVYESVSFEEQLRAFDELIRQGKVRYMGVSNESPFGVMNFHFLSKQLNLPQVVSIQNSYSLLNRVDFETDLDEVCAPNNCNVGLLAYSPLAGGILSGKYTDKADPEESKKWRLNLFEGYMARFMQSSAKKAADDYAALAQKFGMSPTQLALAFTNSRPFVASTIIGATTLKQLRENIGAFSIEWNEDLEKEVDKIFRVHKDPAKNPFQDPQSAVGQPVWHPRVPVEEVKGVAVKK